MRRFATERFELAQIWTSDDKIAPLDTEQRARMKAQFRTESIPLHAAVDPRDAAQLARFRYDPRMKPADYLAFLESALAAYRAK